MKFTLGDKICFIGLLPGVDAVDAKKTITDEHYSSCIFSTWFLITFLNGKKEKKNYFSTVKYICIIF